MKEVDQRSPAHSAAHRHRRRNEHDLYAGERLRIARRLAGCSQQELAQHLGISFQAVQKYENGENRLSAGRLVKAALFLGVDLAFFAKDPAAGANAQPWTFTEHELDLIRAYRALADESLRTHVRQLLLTMAQMAQPADPPRRH
jgi:transcriptional regulator with XRE-family HTH domain